MSGVGYGTQFTPNLCFCGHDLTAHSPTYCNLCANAHAFGPEPVIQAHSQTGGGANANGQRNG